MLVNLKKAALDRETVKVAGGEFSPAEVKAFANSVQDAAESLADCIQSLEYWFRRNGDPEGCNSMMMQKARAALKNLGA